MTSDPVADVAPDEVTAPAVLGAGMAHRARSQSVLAQHWSPSGLIGAVGRASVGFGLAVGRSRAIRPTVRFEDLNSAALRPSPDLWRAHRNRIGTAAVDGDAMDAEVGVRTSVAAPTTVQRSAMAGSDRSSRVAVHDRGHRRPRRSHRPSWTDQIIERSSIGFVAPAPGSPMPEPAPPADFVPSGDARLDRLRLLVQARESGPEDRAEPIVRRTTASNSTVSIATDAPVPGRLARSMRPESALSAAVPPSRAGGGTPLPERSASTDRSTPGRSPDRSAAVTPGAQRSPGAPSRRGAQRSAEPTKLDRLRSMLVEQGILSPDPVEPLKSAEPDRGGDQPTGVTQSPGRPETPRTGAGMGTESAVIRARSTSTELRRATSESPGRATSPAPRPASGGDRAAVVGESPVPSVPIAEAATTPTPSARATAPAVAAGQLRAQRLLRSGLGRDIDVATNADVRIDTPTPGGAVTAPSQFAVAATAVGTSSSIDLVDPQALPSIGRPSSRRTDTPTLVRTDSPPEATLIRRVTLPRALSSQHRPATMSTTHRVAAGAPPVQRASIVALDHAVTARSNTEPTGSPGSSVWPGARRATSLVPAGTGALLEVVRRASAVREPSIGDGFVETSARRVPEHGRPGRRGMPIRPGSGTDGGSVGTLEAAEPATSRTADRSESSDAVRASALSAAVAPPAAVIDRSPTSQTLGVQRLVAAEPHAGAAGAGANTAAPAGSATAGSATAEPPPRAPVDTSPEVMAEPLRPSERVAAQFMTALSETVRRRPAPLPTSFRPMAEAIAGPRPVMLSTDAASRRALRSVGKVAATTGDTIHLDHQAIPAVRLDEVMAHELTHIAHPSPTPRFFDDIDDSPEERRAEQVARVMARSPLSPSASTSAPPVRRRHDPDTIGRSTSPSAPPAPASSQGSVSAAALAASITGAGSATGVVQRWVNATPSAQRPQIGSHRSTPAPANTPAPSSSPQADAGSSEGFGSDRSVEWFREQLDQHLDRVVRMLEDRMIVELERRGGRAWRQS